MHRSAQLWNRLQLGLRCIVLELHLLLAGSKCLLDSAVWICIPMHKSCHIGLLLLL